MNFILRILWELFFRCRHERVTRIISNRQRCLICGKSRRYDLRTMRTGKWRVDRIEQAEQQIYYFEVAED